MSQKYFVCFGISDIVESNGQIIAYNQTFVQFEISQVIYRNSHMQVFHKTGALKNFKKFKGKVSFHKSSCKVVKEIFSRQSQCLLYYTMQVILEIYNARPY